MFENETSPLEEYVPTYIPTGFVRSDKSLWFNRTYIGLQLFYHDSQRHYLRLELSPGPIGDLMSMNSEQIQHHQLEVGRIKVDLTSVRAVAKFKREVPPLISATWERDQVHFRLQTNGLDIEEVKKIVASSMS